MFSEKGLRIAFIFSLCTHGVILSQGQNSILNIVTKPRNEHMLEVSYVKNLQDAPKLQPNNKPAPPKVALGLKEPFLDLSAKITAAKVSPPAFIDKDKIFRGSREMISENKIFTKPAFAKPDIIAVKKKISMPPIDLDKIDNPSYISYYQIVREKIRRAAYQNYTRAEVGEVYLSFLILADGSLGAVQLIEDKSSPSQYLRGIALRSIKEASPFPGFPKELDYPQLSFNVVISFEIE